MDKLQLLELRKEYGDAFYLLDSFQFKKNYDELKTAFSSIYKNFNIAYSYKTNYTPKLCKIVNELGGYAEVVSEMELELAQRIGVKLENIIWNGPVKNPIVLENYLLTGGEVNIDNLDELKFIKKVVKDNPNNEFRVGIRVNYDVQDGVISRFGFDSNSDEFNEVLGFVTKTANVKLVSIHCHFAKRQIEYWPARAKGMIELLDRIGIVPKRVDLGGGIFGKMEDSLKKQFTSRIPEYDEYAKAAATIFAERFGYNGPELIIEPGSALVGDCMQFVGTVKSIKNIRGKYFASILGSQKNISMTGVNPPIEVIHVNNGTKYENLDMVGFTCIEGDVIYKNYNGELAIGDSIVISNCGSYSLVMKPPFILPNFAVLDISEGKVELVKRAENFDDLFHTFNY